MNVLIYIVNCIHTFLNHNIYIFFIFLFTSFIFLYYKRNLNQFFLTLIITIVLLSLLYITTNKICIISLQNHKIAISIYIPEQIEPGSVIPVPVVIKNYNNRAGKFRIGSESLDHSFLFVPGNAADKEKNQFPETEINPYETLKYDFKLITPVSNWNDARIKVFLESEEKYNDLNPYLMDKLFRTKKAAHSTFISIKYVNPLFKSLAWVLPYIPAILGFFMQIIQRFLKKRKPTQ